MSKHMITHSCGHDHEYSLFGKHSERDRKIEWLADQECPSCRTAASRVVENAAGPQFTVVISYPFDSEIERKRLTQKLELAKLELGRIESHNLRNSESKLRTLVENRTLVQNIRDLETPFRPGNSIRKSEPGWLRIVGHSGTFQVKDDLKSRGYRFGEMVLPKSPLDLMSPGTKCWTKSFPIDQLRGAFKDEYEWIESKGWKIDSTAIGSPMELMAAVAAGDPRYYRQSPAMSDEEFAAAKAKIEAECTRDLEIEAELGAKQDEEARELAKLRTFKPKSATMDETGLLTVFAADGRKATGRNCGDGSYVSTMIYQDGREVKLNLRWPECDEIGRIGFSLLNQSKEHD